MTVISTYLDQLSSFGPYYEELRSRAKEVKPVSYKELPHGARKKVERFIRRRAPRIKECYYNASILSLEYPEFRYVEGLAHRFIPVHHAWNSYKGVHFDITYELHSDLAVEYAKVISLPAFAVSTVSVRHGFYGEFIPFLFRRQLTGVAE